MTEEENLYYYNKNDLSASGNISTPSSSYSISSSSSSSSSSTNKPTSPPLLSSVSQATDEREDEKEEDNEDIIMLKVSSGSSVAKFRIRKVFICSYAICYCSFTYFYCLKFFNIITIIFVPYLFFFSFLQTEPFSKLHTGFANKIQVDPSKVCAPFCSSYPLHTNA